MHDQIAAAIAAARSTRTLDDVARVLWRAAAEGHLGEDAAGRLAEALETRRAAFRLPRPGTAPRAPAARPRPAQRSPDRARSIERRRRLATGGWMPPQIACQFTVSQAAALAIVAQEVARRGSCTLPLDAIAALAGCSRTLVKDALREAARLGLITVTERRITAWRNLPNVVRIVSPEWLTWLRLRGGRGQKGDQHADMSTKQARSDRMNGRGTGAQPTARPPDRGRKEAMRGSPRHPVRSPDRL